MERPLLSLLPQLNLKNLLQHSPLELLTSNQGKKQRYLSTQFQTGHAQFIGWVEEGGG